jgi:prepilin-type N-terminal cleavage/methylation domain-containing protein/prepilin-type processing-associated H-X9-DG protein
MKRRAFTLIELLVVLAIISVLIGLLLPAVQKVREAASRLKCANNLKQIGLALHGYHNSRDGLPPGLVSEDNNITNGDHTGFTFLLPFIEQDNTHKLYHYDQSWYADVNYAAVAVSLPLYLCPSNRSQAIIDLSPMIAQWDIPMPPVVGGLDYAFSKGANGAVHQDGSKVPAPVRGAFGITHGPDPRGVRLLDIRDGTSNTFAIGEAAGGNPLFLVRDLTNPTQAAISGLTGRPAIIDQAWGAGCVTYPYQPWYGSVFAVTAQYGLPPAVRDEPMNQRLVPPTVWGDDPAGDNARGKDAVSGFRSLHAGGCNFLFCDGSVRFVRQSVSPDVYRALSTILGGEVISATDY